MAQCVSAFDGGQPAMTAMRPRPSGYCYLDLFQPEFQGAAAELGCEPTVGKLAAFVASHTGSLISGMVTLALRMSGRDIVAHVQYNDGHAGVFAHKVLECLPAEVHLGATPAAGWPANTLAMPPAYDQVVGPTVVQRGRGYNYDNYFSPRRPTPHPNRGHEVRVVADIDGSDGDSDGEPTLADRNGFCYLRLLRAELWAEAASVLGLMPTVSNLNKFLRTFANPFISHGVAVSYHTVDGQIVVHVSDGPRDSRIPAGRVLGVVLPELRIGVSAPKDEPDSEAEGGVYLPASSTLAALLAELRVAPPPAPTVADEVEEADGPDDVQDGYCYLYLFKDSLREEAARMGPKPTVADLRRFANAHADPYSRLDCLVSLTVESDGVALAHVFPSKRAGVLTPGQVVAALDKRTRVGSSGTVSVVRDSTPNEAAAGTPVSMEVRQTRPIHYVQLPIGGYLNHIENYMMLNPRNIRGLRRTFGLFESVRLEEFSITVTIQGDISTVARVAANIEPHPPKDNGAWATSEASMTITGNAQGATVSDFTLPTNHQFGRELKGLSISNEPPIFHFYVTSGVPCHIWFRGHFKLAMSGQGNPPGVDLSATAGKMASIHPTCVITTGTGMGQVSDDSDDEEPQAKPRTPQAVRGTGSGNGSSPTANTGARR